MMMKTKSTKMEMKMIHHQKNKNLLTSGEETKTMMMKKTKLMKEMKMKF